MGNRDIWNLPADERAALRNVSRRKSRAAAYAGQPGTGPAGKTCQTCAHKTYTGGAKLHPKCGLTAYTCGDATTIKTRTPACHKYEAAK